MSTDMDYLNVKKIVINDLKGLSLSKYIRLARLKRSPQTYIHFIFSSKL
jgi:hypothetical protein